MTADKGGIVMRKSIHESRNGSTVTTVTERDSGIAGKPFSFGALDRSPTEAVAVLFHGHREQWDKRGVRVIHITRLEGGRREGQDVPVRWADFLADVAAKDPVAHL